MFTQPFGKHPKNVGLADMPVFGHSDNHAGLQIADLLCSAVLAPIACVVYAGAYASWNRHCDSGFLDLREQFGSRLQALTFSWFNPQNKRTGRSVVVRDPIGKRSTSLMWGPERITKTRSAPQQPSVVSSTRPAATQSAVAAKGQTYRRKKPGTGRRSK